MTCVLQKYGLYNVVGTHTYTTDGASIGYIWLPKKSKNYMWMEMGTPIGSHKANSISLFKYFQEFPKN